MHVLLSIFLGLLLALVIGAVIALMIAAPVLLFERWNDERERAAASRRRHGEGSARHRQHLDGRG